MGIRENRARGKAFEKWNAEISPWFDGGKRTKVPDCVGGPDFEVENMTPNHFGAEDFQESWKEEIKTGNSPLSKRQIADLDEGDRVIRGKRTWADRSTEIEEFED